MEQIVCLGADEVYTKNLALRRSAVIALAESSALVLVILIPPCLHNMTQTLMLEEC